MITHNTHNKETSMPPAGFEPAIPASEKPQTHALDGAATGISYIKYTLHKIILNKYSSKFVLSMNDIFESNFNI